MRYGAGILAVCPSTRRALVLRRSAKVSEPLTWAPPGGGEEAFDEGHQRWTAVREFIEETGHSPSGAVIPLATIHGHSGPFHQFVSIESREFEPVLDWESEGALWLTLDQLLTLPDKHPGFAYLMDNDVVRKDLCTRIIGMPFFDGES